MGHTPGKGAAPVTIAMAVLLLTAQCSGGRYVNSQTWYAGIYAPTDQADFEERYRCEAPRQHTVYYFFFGTTMLRREDPKTLFPEPDRYVYAFEQKKTTMDWIISILFGTMFSVTRNTLEIRQCVGTREADRIDARKRVEEAQRRARERAEAAREAAERAAERARRNQDQGGSQEQGR